MVCAPVRSIIPSLKLGDYLSVQAHKPCSISLLLRVTRLKPSAKTDRKTLCYLAFINVSDCKVDLVLFNIVSASTMHTSSFHPDVIRCLFRAFAIRSLLLKHTI